MQLNWDAGVEVGAMARAVTSAAAGASAPTPGPVGELFAHVALLPMLRAGVYASHDISPEPGAPAREITEGGLSVRLLPPLLAAPWRTWAFAGVGYARAYAPSHRAEIASPGGAVVPGAGGGILDVPFGLGLAYRPRRPWEYFAELGGRAGAFFTGSLYSSTRAQCVCPSPPFAGKDSFALLLTVGVSFDQ
ncbi:MAG TPA: hypothetical protein VKU41_26140 [Polyangiaceae bacterium]|nr:hypothetical protein [Polyangiaceae bacterium]